MTTEATSSDPYPDSGGEMSSVRGPTRPVAVVVHYGDPVATVRLANTLADYDVEVMVVANDLRPLPPELDDRVQWLVPERNLGYGDAFNFVVARRPRSAYVLLNTDLTMPRATFDRCLAVLGQDRVGIVAPVLRRADGSLQSGAARLTRWCRAPRVLFDPGPRVVDCTWVTGAAMFIKGEVARSVGMDGSYFLGAEDADLCIRAARSGWRVVCCGDVSAEHRGSVVIAGPRWSYYASRNRVWWTRANFGLGPATLSWLVTLIGLPRVLAADVLRRHDLTSSRLTILGLRHAFRRKPDRSLGSLVDEPLAGRVMKW